MVALALLELGLEDRVLAIAVAMTLTLSGDSPKARYRLSHVPPHHEESFNSVTASRQIVESST